MIELVLVFIGLMVLVLVYARFVPQRPPTVEEVIQEWSVRITGLAHIFGTQLVPVFQEAADAIRGFVVLMEQDE